MLEALPYRKVSVLFRIPILVELIPRKDANLSGSTFNNPGMLDAIDRNTSRAS